MLRRQSQPLGEWRDRRSGTRHRKEQHRIGGKVFALVADPGARPRASSVRNAIAGDLGSVTFLVFDCRFGAGKHRFSQTVVAVKGPLERLGFQRFNSTLVKEPIEDWTLVFRRKELLLTEEIETLLPAM